ncbi:MAG: hypothetical protein KKH92_01270, partial [Firmicutes bacterium]|nr:hypothetical protein [Bacillota bacterium]
MDKYKSTLMFVIIDFILVATLMFIEISNDLPIPTIMNVIFALFVVCIVFLINFKTYQKNTFNYFIISLLIISFIFIIVDILILELSKSNQTFVNLNQIL